MYVSDERARHTHIQKKRKVRTVCTSASIVAAPYGRVCVNVVPGEVRLFIPAAELRN